MLPGVGQKATMLYEMPGGIFRQRKVAITSEGLIQDRVRWFHDNHEECVFPIEEPIKLESYEQLLDAPDSPHPQIPSGWMAIGEENGFFPYSSKVILDWQDIENRQHRRLEYQDVGRQNAELRNIKRSLGNPLLTTFALMAAAVIALMVVIGATAMLVTILGNDETAPSPAVMIGMLGAVMALPGLRFPKRKAKAAKKPKIKAARKPIDPFWVVYLYCTVTGKKKRYALPFSQVYAYIPPECWRYPVRTYWRRGGATACAAFVFLWEVLILWAEPTLLLIMIPLILISVPFAGILGFFIARPVMYKISWFHRPYCKVHRFQDQDGNYFLEPIRYTGLTGVDPLLWESLINRNLEQAKKIALEEKLDQLPQYDPIVNRADDAYEDVTGLLEREDTMIPMSAAQKIQLGSVVVMAIGSVFTAFFIVMATVGG